MNTQQLQDRVFELEEMLGMNIKLPAELLLTPAQTIMAGLLSRKEIVSRDMFFTALYGAKPDCDQADIQTIDVQLCKLRKNLGARGIKIKNRWNIGWYLSADDRGKLREMSA